LLDVGNDLRISYEALAWWRGLPKWFLVPERLLRLPGGKESVNARLQSVRVVRRFDQVSMDRSKNRGVEQRAGMLHVVMRCPDPFHAPTNGVLDRLGSVAMFTADEVTKFPLDLLMLQNEASKCLRELSLLSFEHGVDGGAVRALRDVEPHRQAVRGRFSPKEVAQPLSRTRKNENPVMSIVGR
jgi:hypothetical protein